MFKNVFTHRLFNDYNSTESKHYGILVEFTLAHDWKELFYEVKD